MLVQERHKTAMIAAGRWRATALHVQGHAGFRLNALVSPLANASWGRLAEEFLRAKADTDELRVFVNTILAQGWQDQAEEVDELALASRVEPFSLAAIPEAVRSITTGVDVQDDRSEVSLVGWSEAETFVLGHVIVWGAPDDDTTWAELDELLRSKWKHPFGGEIGIDAAVIDSGAWTDSVYAYCFPRLRRRIWAGKGVAGSRPAIAMSKGKVKGGRLFIVGADSIKTAILSRLSRGRSVRFSDTLEPVYFEQLASERKVIRYNRGQPVKRFERKPGARAEALDCMVYAFAAHAGAPIPASREAELRSSRSQPVKKPPAVIKSKWLQGA